MKFAGVAAIILGVVILLTSFDVIALPLDAWWPAVMIGLGVYMLIGALRKNGQKGALMPASILIVYGALFLVCVTAGWSIVNSLWPIYLLGPGIGFLLMYIFADRSSASLIPSLILLLLTAFFFLQMGFPNAGQYNLPAVLVVIGLLILLPRKK